MREAIVLFAVAFRRFAVVRIVAPLVAAISLLGICLLAIALLSVSLLSVALLSVALLSVALLRITLLIVTLLALAAAILLVRIALIGLIAAAAARVALLPVLFLLHAAFTAEDPVARGQCRPDRLMFAVAQNAELDAGVVAGPSNRLDQVLRLRHALAVDGQNIIAALQPGLVGGAAGQHAANFQAVLVQHDAQGGMMMRVVRTVTLVARCAVAPIVVGIVVGIARIFGRRGIRRVRVVRVVAGRGISSPKCQSQSHCRRGTHGGLEPSEHRTSHGNFLHKEAGLPATRGDHLQNAKRASGSKELEKTSYSPSKAADPGTPWAKEGDEKRPASGIAAGRLSAAWSRRCRATRLSGTIPRTRKSVNDDTIRPSRKAFENFALSSYSDAGEVIPTKVTDVTKPTSFLAICLAALASNSIQAAELDGWQGMRVIGQSGMPTRMLAADLDGQGRDQLIVVNTRESRLDLYRWLAADQREAPVARDENEPNELPLAPEWKKSELVLEELPLDLAVQDLDGDGKPELIVLTSPSNKVVSYQHEAADKWKKGASWDLLAGAPAGRNPLLLRSLGEGKFELLVSCEQGIQTLRLEPGNRD